MEEEDYSCGWVGNPNRVVSWGVAVIVIAASIGCAPPTPKQPLNDPFFDDDSPSLVSGNFDDDESKWRQEIAGERATDPDALLKDDPARAPDAYGTVAKDAETKPPESFWDTVGKASFAAMTVVVTLGMMVAPYLLL